MKTLKKLLLKMRVRFILAVSFSVFAGYQAFPQQDTRDGPNSIMPLTNVMWMR